MRNSTALPRTSRTGRSFDELPATVQAYIKELERIIECPITMLGVGPARDQVMEIHI